MVNFPWSKPKQREAIQIEHGKRHDTFLAEAGKGETRQTFGTWSDKLPHPANMPKYQVWSADPQVRIGIDLKTDMVAGAGFYLQMPEKDAKGKEIDAEHTNKSKGDQYLKDIGFRDLYKQIQRQKYEMGFTTVEVLPDRTLKILPSNSIYFWKKPKIGRAHV